MDSTTLINSLQQANAYPHTVSNVQLIETHISWVLLTGDYAYKVKKPVDFGFLNFSTLEQRKFFCGEELRLNRRYAPDIYLGVVPISVDNNNVKMDNSNGEVIDYAVKMRQFDTSKTLDILAAQKGLDLEIIHQIGRDLAEFHNRLMASKPPSADLNPQLGSPEAVWFPINENFKQIAPMLENQLHLNDLADIKQQSIASFNDLKELIQSRFDNGFIRECHGDLHLGNMAKKTASEDNNEVLFFDCIEFNVSFRQIDVMSELAFTLMDLEAREMPTEANALLNTYLEYRDDYAGLKLLNFYKTYYAIVRAKVSLLETGSANPSEIKAHPKYTDFIKYIDLAKSYAKHIKPFIAITHGVSGSGKSTIAEQISGASNAIRIRSDVERKHLFGLQPHEASDQNIYTKEASQNTFKRLGDLLTVINTADYSAIVDATFLHKNRRDDFAKHAKQLNSSFWILDCQAPIEELEQRLTFRAQDTQEASEADIDVLRSQLKHQEALTQNELESTIAIDTSSTFNVKEIVDKLHC